MRRVMLHMSQEELGQAFGLTFQQVQKYEKGTNRMGASRLQHAAHILDVPVPFFFQGAPGQQAEDGTAPSPSYVNEFVSSEDGLRLIKAFMRIARTAVRRRIVGTGAGDCAQIAFLPKGKGLGSPGSDRTVSNQAGVNGCKRTATTG
jgi:transcriptional regulator with XRE-family HTH domain